MVVENGDLGEVADLMAEFFLSYCVPHDPQGAVVRFKEAEQQLDGGGFPRAVGAEKAEDLTFGNREGKIRKRRIFFASRAEALADTIYFNG